MEAYNHDSASASPTTSPSSQWIRSIQNESFQPKPTAYSPHSLEDEDPLMLQQRQCRDKLRVLKKVRERIKFYPLQHLDKRGNSSSYSMKISTSMILSGADESPDWQKDAKQSDGQSKNVGQNVGIDELGGLEMLLFAFFSPQELLRVSGVCRAWRALARDDLFWEPLLVTQLEKYPLRSLLGLERDPTRPHEDVPAILVYMVYQRLKIAQTAYKTECSDTTNNIHTATTNAAATRYNGRFLEIFQTINRQGQFNSAASALRTQNQEMTRMVELHLRAVAHQAAPPVEAPNAAVLVPDQQQPVVHGAGAADDEDVYSVADGRDRMTLNGWLSTKRRVSERTLRSYLRQMLLAVFALERSNFDADMNVPAPILDVNGEIAQQRQRLAAVEADVGVGGNGIAIAAAFRNRIALPQASMVGSVVQTAMTVWARGRFVDANTSTVLALLLRFPDSFSSSLRSFLEYAKYLIITHSVSASKLLRHEYLQCSATELDRRSSPHWSTTRIHDVNEYKSKLVAYYGNLPSRVEGLLDDNPQVIDELMPRTNLGLRYFSRALEENNLRSERFVSVVAPSTASSSWVRTLASTQTYENLEHLVAALAYAKFLPQLRGLDEDVRQAIDRLEKSYLMQLDMVTFLLQKPSVSNTAPGARTGD
ncbi:hypothetical protein JG688_00002031 [Phytophthora aleatoria]|uniref:F-box domain-containing protein n=1 Tax=Phytophthora aleatoria TaxID=2496075 RepID=A0A8J5IV50_9STRA|nr:hypothetical protein JG688_00002031 [Phytophthora aleatoria]